MLDLLCTFLVTGFVAIYICLLFYLSGVLSLLQSLRLKGLGQTYDSDPSAWQRLFLFIAILSFASYIY